MRTRPLAPLLGAAILLVPAAWAQFWEQKEYQKWSEGECRNLLQNSPWAKTFTISRVLIQPLQVDPATPGRESNPQINYIVQIWSARPIRQALVRRGQLSGTKKRLPAEEQKALEEREAKFIAADFPDTIVIDVLYQSNVQSYELDLARYWQTQLPDQVKQTTYLISRAGKVQPLQVNISQRGRQDIQLIFPRQVNGKPMLSPEDKHLALEMQHPTIGILGGQRIYVEFDVKKMVVNGQLAY